MKIGVMIALLLAFMVGTLGLDNISRGPAHTFSSAHCGAGRILVQSGGVPCTGRQQDFGWPIKAHTKYTAQQAVNGQWVPSYQYVCYSGCGRSSLSYNGLLLAGAVLSAYGVYALVANWQLNKQLRQYT